MLNAMGQKTSLFRAKALDYHTSRQPSEATSVWQTPPTGPLWLVGLSLFTFLTLGSQAVTLAEYVNGQATVTRIESISPNLEQITLALALADTDLLRVHSGQLITLQGEADHARFRITTIGTQPNIREPHLIVSDHAAPSHTTVTLWVAPDSLPPFLQVGGVYVAYINVGARPLLAWPIVWPVGRQ
jgi:hypothetical protein